MGFPFSLLARYRVGVRGSVLSPLLWLVGFCITAAVGLMVMAATAPLWLAVVAVVLVVGLIAVPIGWLLRYYSHFARSDPSKLQSESYQLRERAMAYLQAQNAPIPLGMLEPILNPDPELPGAEPPKESE